MKILVTGAKGFVGKNLCAQLKNIRDGKARNYGVDVEEVFEYDVDSEPLKLDEYCAAADFVFNLAGVNRPKDPKEFKVGNVDFATTLLETLRRHGNKCPVMLASSQQASLAGRFGNSEYGKALFLLTAFFKHIHYLVYIIRYLGQKYNFNTARNTCVQIEPACFVTHYLNYKYTAVTCRR